MAKIIRPTYPLEFSIGLLLLIFALSTFLSFEIFDVRWREITEGEGPLLGMLLSGIAVIVMSLILWEEFLFPVRIKPDADQIVFRNHVTKLRTQVLIYSVIPGIIGFIYVNYEVSYVPFFIWAVICAVAPLAGKLISGIRNYNDFLKLTNETIEYKNNEKEGVLPVNEIREIILIKDDSKILHKVKVVMLNNNQVVIDLDEMELDPYCQAINGYIKDHYKHFVKEDLD
jgi:hypothetical protein